jgi:hypothetical protein
MSADRHIVQLTKHQERGRNGYEAEPVPDEKLIRRMSDVTSRAIRWAWRGRLALGYMTVQTGEEGLGKSVFAAWLAGQATRGLLDGDWYGKPVDVLIVASEDGIEDTWSPRLAVAGADLERVSSLNLDELPIGWNIRDGINELRRAVLRTGAKLILFDALLDNMPPPTGGENINSPTFVRAALEPLRQLVRELDIVAVISLHPPKSRGFAFRDFVQGSQAFSAGPRLGLLFGWHPDDAEDDPNRRRVILRGKGNIGRNPGALEFRVDGRDHLHGDGLVQEREVVVGVQPTDVTLAQLTARAGAGSHEAHSKAQEAADLISEWLSDGNGHPAAATREMLAAHDLNSDSVVQRAKQLAGVHTRKEHGSAHGVWEWYIPKNPAPPTYPATDSWTENSPHPQQPREESKNPSLLTTGSWNGSEHTDRQWRLPGGQWLESDRFPPPVADPTIEWRDAA